MLNPTQLVNGINEPRFVGIGTCFMYSWYISALLSNEPDSKFQSIFAKNQNFWVKNGKKKRTKGPLKRVPSSATSLWDVSSGEKPSLISASTSEEAEWPDGRTSIVIELCMVTVEPLDFDGVDCKNVQRRWWLHEAPKIRVFRRRRRRGWLIHVSVKLVALSVVGYEKLKLKLNKSNRVSTHQRPDPTQSSFRSKRFEHWSEKKQRQIWLDSNATKDVC